jgi:hypothetical protein
VSVAQRKHCAGLRDVGTLPVEGSVDQAFQGIGGRRQSLAAPAPTISRRALLDASMTA